MAADGMRRATAIQADNRVIETAGRAAILEASPTGQDKAATSGHRAGRDRRTLSAEWAVVPALEPAAVGELQAAAAVACHAAADVAVRGDLTCGGSQQL